jgi:adenine deaminase
MSSSTPTSPNRDSSMTSDRVTEKSLMLFQRCRIYDEAAREWVVRDVLSDGATVTRVSADPLDPAELHDADSQVRVIDCGGRNILTPGLVDNHVHLLTWLISFGAAVTLDDNAVKHGDGLKGALPHLAAKIQGR